MSDIGYRRSDFCGPAFFPISEIRYPTSVKGAYSSAAVRAHA